MENIIYLYSILQWVIYKKIVTARRSCESLDQPVSYNINVQFFFFFKFCFPGLCTNNVTNNKYAGTAKVKPYWIRFCL